MTRPLTPTQLSQVDQITAEFGRQLGILVETHRRLLAKGDQAPVASISAMLADDPEWGEPALTALAAVAVGRLARLHHAVEQLADQQDAIAAKYTTDHQSDVGNGMAAAFRLVSAELRKLVADHG